MFIGANAPVIVPLKLCDPVSHPSVVAVAPV
jgi:hypothetical protein